ncbi:MAG: hypothetical protein ACKVOE_09065 [Rickettsiales bacterium]
MRIFLFVLAGTLLATRYFTTVTSKKMSEAKIDEELEESFPSSDAPSWTMGVERKVS